MQVLTKRRLFLFASLFLTFAFILAFLPPGGAVNNDALNPNTPNNSSTFIQREHISKIHLITSDKGFALTTNRLLRTEDAGATWLDMTPKANGAPVIYDAFFLDESNGWAVLSSSSFATTLQIAKTNDGGKSWTSRAVNVSYEALAEFGSIAYLDFIDTQRGWLMLKQMTSSNFSRGVLLSTSDGGESWKELSAPPIGDEINFVSATNGWLTGGPVGDKLYVTRDSGRTWQEKKVRANERAQIIYAPPTFTSESNGVLPVTVSGEVGSSIEFYETRDGGQTWRLASKSTVDGARVGEAFPSSVADDGVGIAALSSKSLTNLKSDGREIDISLNNLLNEEAITQIEFKTASSALVLTAAGRCESFKKNCVQESRLWSTKDGGRSLRNVTPPLLVQAESSLERIASLNDLYAPPGNQTHISNKLGFDKCTAAPFSQMTTWWNYSPFYDVNIYIGGQNRGCTQAQLTPTWVDQVSTQGWGLIPTWVGLQSPCSSCTNCVKHSTDPATAEQQGRAEADAAHAAAVNLGMAAGTIVYFDMERYTVPSPDTNQCRASTRAFLNGWTGRMHELGDISGVYGSPCNAREDWTSSVISNSPDAVWMARWLIPPKIWDFSPCSIDPNWTNNQRIHQYQGDHNETWGGITFNIDRDMSNAPVVGPANNNKTVFRLPPADFDGDSKTDISVWRPSNGVWYVLNSTSGTFFAAPFGAETDKLVPGDYDGDGWVDFGIYRPSEGNWHIYLRRSISPLMAQYRVFTFGAAEDIPVNDDFDGDARTDYAVFRPSNGTWYIYNQSNRSVSIVQFGITGDLPVAGDYDGDGKADIAVWRPSTGVWYILNSSNGSYTIYQFGVSTDKLAHGDYDADGKTDIAVYRPESGTWFALRSTQGLLWVQFGLPEDIPTPGDYDGDKVFDLAVFRQSTGIWYIQRSQAGFYAAQFGQQGDKPIPTAYTPLGH